MLVSASFVLLMTPGLAFFHGGLVRRKNILSVLMRCFMARCLMTVLWVLVGYSLAFSNEHVLGGFVGSLKYVLRSSRGHGGGWQEHVRRPLPLTRHRG
jgi:Amt family ammonium transporter